MSPDGNDVGARHLLPWIFLAAAVGLGASLIFSGVLRLSRGAFVLAYAVCAGAFLGAFFRRHRHVGAAHLRRNRAVGLAGGVFAGALLVRQVFAQPESPHAAGFALAIDVAWYGVVYGAVDALLLTVVPVLGIYGARSPWEGQPGVIVSRGLAALLASAFVTAAYHAGFAEFRGAQLVHPVIGNTIITLSYLLTGSPIAPLVAHVAMHTAAVLQGMATTMQLPPHY